MASVQFYGLKEVITAAERIKCPAWGIFSGKQMLFKYEGEDEAGSIDLLNEILSALQNRSIATYTLKFFEQDGKPIKINEKSVCDAGSFNFKLTETEEDYFGKRAAFQNSQYEKRLAALEEGNQDSEPQTIGEILQQPEVVKQYIEVFSMVKNLLSGVPVQPAYIGNVTRAGTVEQTPEDQQMKLITAINILEQNDPQIIAHLEKLAKISRDNKPLFSQLLAMLDNIP